MLPKIDVPIYEVKLPLLNKVCRFRPFLVKEEKLLLMAMESDDEKTISNTIKQIINNCCIDDINVDSMPVSDLEFFFLNLRARSIGENVELQYKCNNKIEDANGDKKDCGHVMKYDLNVLEIEPKIPENHTNKIELDKNMGIVMKYPNFKIVENVSSSNSNEIEQILGIIVNCIDYIYDSESVYYAKDVDKKELQEFVESLSREQFVKVQTFFETLPKIQKEIDFNCSKCGYEEKIFVEGLQNFFV